MNKLFNKIAAGVVGLAMAVGVGVAIGSQSKAEARSVSAASVTRSGSSPLSTTAEQLNDYISISTSSANTYSNPCRAYANVTITITAVGAVLDSVTYESSSTGSYVTNAQAAAVTPSVTPTVSGKEVTWTFTTSPTEFTFTPSAQTRWNNIIVEYSVGGSSEYVIEFDDSGSDSTQAITADAALSYTTKGKAYISSFSNINKVYKGTSGLKFGSSSAVGSITLNFTSAAQTLFNGKVLYATFKNYNTDTGDFVFTSSGLTGSPVSVSKASVSSLTESEVGKFSSSPASLTVATSNKRGYLKSLRIAEAPAGYKVTYDKNTTDEVNNLPAAETGLSSGVHQLSATQPSRWGYTFSGWAADAQSTTAITSVTISSSDIVVYAIWAEDHTVPGAFSDCAYTIAQAKDAIDNGGHVNNVYVQGIISQIDSYDSGHKSITYWISSDGTTTGQFEVYSGKGLNGAEFSSIDDISLKASVVVFGSIKKYNSIYEFNYNNYLVSYVPFAEPYIDFANEYRTTLVGLSKVVLPEFDNLGENTISYNSSNTSVATVNNSTGEVTGVSVGSTTITASATVSGTPYSSSYILYVKASAYTVAEARAYIDAGNNLDDQYVTGYISDITSQSLESNNGITYWISDDGTKTNELQAYKGKNIAGADFTSISDLSVGDLVVICGDLLIYDSKYELNVGNYLISKQSGLDTYTVTYTASDADSGSVPTDSQNPYVTGSTVTVLGNTGNLAKDGYTFAGWSNGTTTYQAGETFTISGNVTLTAQWQEVVPSGDITASNTITQIVADNNYTISSGQDVTCYTEFALDSNVTISTSGEPNCGSFWGATTQDWRIYQNKGGDITISVPSGYSLVSVKITYTVSSGGTLLDGETVIASGTSYEVSGTSVTYTVGNTGAATNGQVRVTSLEVVYSDNSSPSYTASDFADEFLETLSTGSSHVCDAQGNTNLASLKAAWKTLASKWADVSDDKTVITSATPSETGTKYEKTKALYIYIAEKYNTQLQDSELTDYNFMGIQGLNPRSNSRVSVFSDVDTQSGTAIAVTLASILSVAALGGYFFIKKKKVTK